MLIDSIFWVSRVPTFEKTWKICGNKMCSDNNNLSLSSSCFFSLLNVFSLRVFSKISADLFVYTGCVFFSKAFRPQPSVGHTKATWPYEESSCKKLSVQSVVFFLFFKKNYRFIRILFDWNTKGETGHRQQMMGKKPRCQIQVIKICWITTIG